MISQDSFFRFKNVWKLSVSTQIILVTALLLIRVLQSYLGNLGMIRDFPKVVAILAPIYEEIFFRGFILIALMKRFGNRKAIIVSSILFGLWHLKNISALNRHDLILQISYATLFVGPVTAYLATKTKTIWIGVILHFINNIVFPYLPKII